MTATMTETGEELSFEIPRTSKVAVYDKPGSISTRVIEINTPEPGPDEVLIRLTHSGVCHSDLSIMTNGWPNLPFPTMEGQIGGHEGVGIVQKLGPGAEKGSIKVGDRVGVKWQVAKCGHCRACRAGFDGSCSVSHKISGYYTPGTFAEYVVGPSNYVTPIPRGLEGPEAAAMLCAGLTTYSALKKCNAKAGEWVVISGAGGGLGHIATQIAARGLGYRVIAIDHGSKEALAKDCGAEAFIDMTKFDEASIVKEVQKFSGEGASAVVVCAGSQIAYNQALPMLMWGGTLVCVGMPHGEPQPISKACPIEICQTGVHIVGSAIGSQQEAIEVLAMAAEGLIKTHYQLERIEKLGEVFQSMADGRLPGRVVLDLQ